MAHRPRDGGRGAGLHRVGDDVARSRDRRAAARPRHRVVRVPRRQDRRGARVLPQRQAQPQRRPDRLRPRGPRLHRAEVTARDLSALPPDLPVPQDDGAAGPLEGITMPRLELPTTDALGTDLAEAARDKLVLYVYPRTGVPGEDPIPGWDEIPGARGCTPQACAFRDHFEELAALGAHVLGLSAQSTAEQSEFAERVGLPYPLASDPVLALADALSLPTFEAGGRRLYKRLTLIAEQARIVKVFYPVFPPDRNADDVLEWLRRR